MSVRRGIRLGLTIGAVLIGMFAHGTASHAAPGATRAAWTVMVFMNGDNNLEGFALRDFREMAKIGSDADLNIVVQMDRIGTYAVASPSEPIWTDTKRFLIRKKMKPIEKEAVESLGEVNMGDPAALRAFVQWAVAKYPADRYALVVWDHGQGYRAPVTNPSPRSLPFRSATSAPHRSISDDDTDKDHLYNFEVTKALDQVLSVPPPPGPAAPGDPGADPAASAPPLLDILAFDACLMAMAETAYAMRDVAHVMVGSADLEPGAGWDYEHALTALKANLQQSTPEIGRLFVRSYATAYAPDGPFGGDPQTTQSAIVLAQARPLAISVSTFANRLSAGLATHGDAILEARRDCDEFAPRPDPLDPNRIVILFHHVDLGRFASRVHARVSDPAIKQAAEDVLASLKAAVIDNYAGSARSGGKFGSSGLAIYFPLDRQSYTTDLFEEGGYRRDNTVFPVAFVSDPSITWADFLHAYFAKFPSVPRQ